MPCDECSAPRVRQLKAPDRQAIVEILEQAGNFNPAEIACALELVDIALGKSEQRDYFIAVAEDSAGRVHAYVCWGPTPMTRGTFDLYWIVVHPQVQGQGYGLALMQHVEEIVRNGQGRLLIVETSSKESYGKAVRFYRRQGYAEVSRIQDFYDRGDDKLVFVKRFAR